MFETFTAITLLLTVLVPGHIYLSVKARFFVIHRENLAEMALMKYAISGMAVTAITWPISTLLGIDPLGLMLAATDGKGVVSAIQSAPASWIFQLFVVPALLAILNVYLTRIPFVTRLPALLKLKPLEKEADAVEKMVEYMELHNPLVEVLLKNGQKVFAGMEVGSAISREEPFPDMFLRPMFSVDEHTKAWTQAPGDTAMFIRGSDIRLVIMYNLTEQAEEKDTTP